MLVTNNFVFIHMHKTAGQFINNILTQSFPDARSIGYHYPVAQLPVRYHELPVMAFVRNPWDWYVSWYQFNLARGMKNPIFSVLSDNGRYNFDGTIIRMLSLTGQSGEILRNKLIDTLPDESKQGNLSGITKNCIETMEGFDGGYFSWLFDRMVLSGQSIGKRYIGKVENLRQDLIHILNEITGEVDVKLESRIQCDSPVNMSKRKACKYYYNSELIDLVAAKEKLIIDQFDYEFLHSE